jgi:hypothetical protein
VFSCFSILFEYFIGSDESGLINMIQSCCKTCENLFPDVYVPDGKRTVMHDVTGAGLHKELGADDNLNKLGFYQYGKKRIRIFYFTLSRNITITLRRTTLSVYFLTIHKYIYTIGYT